MVSPQVHKNFEISESLTLFNINSESNEDVIKELAELFKKHDFVHETYLDEVLKREKKMPTGLITKAGGVAIPHTDAEHVKTSAIAIARMQSPVKFNNMANPTEKIDVNIVFLLAIADKEQVNPFLGKMAELLQNEQAFLKLLAIENAKNFITYFSSLIEIKE
jgi:PTS system galactitol-specific IIA component